MTDPVAFWTLVLTLFTGVLAIVSIVQWRLLKRADETARKAADAAKESADAAIKSALAAEATVATMKETAERQLRAYVAVDDMAMVERRDASYAQFAAEFTIRNSGETPAHDVRVAMMCRVREFPLTAELPIVTDDKLGPPTVLNPGGTILEDVKDTDMAKEIFHEGVMKNGTEAVYYFGLITYRDIFGKDHRTKFRMYWFGRMARPMAHQAGNEAD